MPENYHYNHPIDEMQIPLIAVSGFVQSVRYFAKWRRTTSGEHLSINPTTTHKLFLFSLVFFCSRLLSNTLQLPGPVSSLATQVDEQRIDQYSLQSKQRSLPVPV